MNTQILNRSEQFHEVGSHGSRKSIEERLDSFQERGSINGSRKSSDDRTSYHSKPDIGKLILLFVF